jgi:hypothetical protein
MWICSRQFWNHVQVGTVVCRVAGSGFKLKMRFSTYNNNIIVWPGIETIFWVRIVKFFDAVPDPGSENPYDPGFGMEKFGSGINIPDPQHS